MKASQKLKLKVTTRTYLKVLITMSAQTKGTDSISMTLKSPLVTLSLWHACLGY